MGVVSVEITQVEGLQLVGSARGMSLVLDTVPKVAGKDAGLQPKPLTIFAIGTPLIAALEPPAVLKLGATLADKHPKSFLKLFIGTDRPDKVKEVLKDNPILAVLKEDIEIEISEDTPAETDVSGVMKMFEPGWSINFMGNRSMVTDISGELGFTAVETFLFSLGGCTGMDTISILMKMRQDLKRFRMVVKAEVDGTKPVAFDVAYIAEGNVDPEKLKKAIDLSRERYCGVQASIRDGIPVNYTYEVR